MNSRMTLFLSLLLVFPVTLKGQTASSQATGQHDCGSICAYCSLIHWEGTDHSANGGYDMTCLFGSSCRIEGCGNGTSLDDGATPPDAIADAIQAATIRELGDIVVAYGDRLFLAADRQAVGITGTQCRERLIARMVFLAPAELNALRDAPIAQLADLLSDGEQGSIIAVQN